MQSLNDFWNDTLQIPEARWIVFGTILVFAVLVAGYVSLFFRNLAVGKTEESELDILSEFRNLRDTGHLDESEYSKLKDVIPENKKPEILRTSVGQSESNPDAMGNSKKKFLTLAEAESKKQEVEQDPARRNGASEDNQVKESD